MFEEIDLLLSTNTIDEIEEFKQKFNNKYNPIIKQYKYKKEEQKLQDLYSEKAIQLGSDELLKLSKNIKITKCKYTDIKECSIKNHEYEYCIDNLITINQIYQYTDRSAYASISVNHMHLFGELFPLGNLKHIFNKLNLNNVSLEQFTEFVSFDNKKMNLKIFKNLKDVI